MYSMVCMYENVIEFKPPPTAVLPRPKIEVYLPSLLIIQLGSLVDDALEEFMNQNRITLPSSGYRPNFDGRIRLLADTGRLLAPQKLHDLRKLRNELAHEADREATLSELKIVAHDACAELQHLGFIKWSCFN
jgi:hypothetical protein